MVKPASATEVRAQLLRDPIPGEALQPDAFGVAPVAERLVRLFRSVQPPFTVSISGAWGIGKTTLTETVKSKSGDLLAGSLDLWARDTENLRRDIVIEIGALLQGGDSSVARDIVAKKLDKALHRSTTVSEPSSRLRILHVWQRLKNDPGAAVWAVAISLVWIFGFVAISQGPDNVAKQILAQFLTAAAVFLLIQSGVFVTIGTTTESMAPAQAGVAMMEEFRRYATTTDQDARPVLMVLDNLDRLTGTEAVRALAEIRALVEVRGSRCLFLIPVDREALKRHLEDELGGDEDDAARDYLDKFFNLDVVLTRPVDLDLRQWARDQAQIALPDASSDDHTTLAQIVASAAGGSPRLVKRMLNGVAARATFLEPLQGQLTLPLLALVEALISRHPSLVEHLATNPQAFIHARLALQQAGDAEKRTEAVANYLTDLELPPPYAGRDSLRDFLLQNEDVSLTADELQTILSLREDRVWLGVPNAAGMKRSLQTGEQDAFEAAFAKLDHTQQDRALQSATETVRVLHKNRFARDGLVAISAIAATVADTKYAGSVRRTGQELLLRSSPAALSDPAVDLLVVPSSDSRGHQVKVRIVQAASGAQPVQGAAAVLRAVRNIAPILSADEQAALQKALGTYQDEDLAVLFEDPGPHTALLRGSVLDNYQKRLASWTPATEDQDSYIATAKRVAWLHEQSPLDSPLLDDVATRVASQLSAATADHLPTLRAIVALLAKATGPVTGIDNLAQQLAAWSQDQSAGLMLAWDLPASPAAVGATKSTTEGWIGSADLDPLETFVRQHRTKLKEEGVDVATLLGNRFAAKGEPRIAALALEDDPVAAALPFATTIAAIANTEIYLRRLTELIDAFSGPPHRDLLSALGDGLAGRMPKIESPNLPAAADRMASLAKAGIEVEPAVAAFGARISGIGAVDVPALCEAAQIILRAKLAGSDGLSDKVLDRATALNEVHLPTLVALGRKSSLDRARQALAAAINKPTNTADQLAPVISGLEGQLRRDWRVTNAAVTRAASLPAAEATALLEKVKGWNKPPRSADERATFDDLLIRIADGNLAPDSRISDFR